jgi:hypothetical protein
MLVRKASTENAELARALQLSLEKMGSHFPFTNSTATLLLIDRGADLKTPLMHDIAFQVFHFSTFWSALEISLLWNLRQVFS